jgi:AcrR family transcriptional regulator
LNRKARQLADLGQMMISGFTVEDLADYAGASRQNIHCYTTGKKDFPNLEARLAAVLSISVKDLRRKLGLPALKNRLPRKTTGRQNKYGAFTESGAG